MTAHFRRQLVTSERRFEKTRAAAGNQGVPKTKTMSHTGRNAVRRFSTRMRSWRGQPCQPRTGCKKTLALLSKGKVCSPRHPFYSPSKKTQDERFVRLDLGFGEGQPLRRACWEGRQRRIAAVGDGRLGGRGVRGLACPCEER